MHRVEFQDQPGLISQATSMGSFGQVSSSTHSRNTPTKYLRSPFPKVPGRHNRPRRSRARLRIRVIQVSRQVRADRAGCDRQAVSHGNIYPLACGADTGRRARLYGELEDRILSWGACG